MPIERGYVRTTWGQLHYRSCGNDGPSLVFLHQCGNSSRMWTAIMEGLGQHHRVVAFDLPGFGMSDPPPAPQPFAGYAQVVVEVMDLLGLGQVTLVGFHTGAALSLALFQQQPDLITGMVLIGVPFFDSTDTTPAAERWKAQMTEPTGAYLQHVWDWHRSVPDQVKHRELADFLLAGEQFVWMSDAVRGFDVRGALPGVTCPVLLLAPTGDFQFAVQAEAARILPNAVLQEIDGPALIADDQPEEVVRQILAFVDEGRGGTLSSLQVESRYEPRLVP